MSRMSDTLARTLPPAIGAYLRRYARRRARLLLVRELSVWLVLLVGYVLLWCLADRLLSLVPALRLTGLVLGAVVFGGWLLVAIRRRVWAPLEERVAAVCIEGQVPGLNERLLTVCSRLHDTGTALASRDMLDQLAGEVEAVLARTSVRKLLPARAVLRHLGCAAAMLAGAAVVMMTPRVDLPLLLDRLLRPMGGQGPVKTTRLRLLPLGSSEIDVREGDAIILEALAWEEGGDGLTLHYSTDGRTWASRPMAAVGLSRYQAVLGPVTAEQWIYVSGGDARTPVVPVVVLRKPAVVQFQMRYEYPAYMNREAFEVANADGLIEAPLGSRVTVRILATERLASATLRGSHFSSPMTISADQWFAECSLQVTRDQVYVLEMASARGLTGAGPDGMQIHALADRAPFVRMVEPGEDLRLGPRDMTRVRYQASDDYGISELAVRLQVNGGNPVEVPVTWTGDHRRTEGALEVDLAALGVHIGDVVSASVVARDGAGQMGMSETRSFFISPHSVDGDAYGRLADLRQAGDVAEAMRQEIEASLKVLESAQKQTPQRPRADLITEYQQHVAQLGEWAQRLKSNLTRVTTRSGNTGLNDLMAKLADVAEQRMIQSHDLVDEMGKDDTRERVARVMLEQAKEQMTQMTTTLQRLLAAEKAQGALLDRRNLQAVEQAQLTGRMSVRAMEMLDRMRQDVADQMRQVGVDPGSTEAEKQLNDRVEAARVAVQGEKPLDLAGAAREWAGSGGRNDEHAPMFDRRLASAAEVESVRRDGDLVWARDLNLAARAAQAIWFLANDADRHTRQVGELAGRQFAWALEDLKRVAQARRAGQHEGDRGLTRAAEAARRKMTMWAGDLDAVPNGAGLGVDEEQKRDLAVAANAEMAERHYERAAELQQRMALEQGYAREAIAAMRSAQAADELGQHQDALREKVMREPEQAGELADQQRDVARQIASQRNPGQAAGVELPRDSRQEALVAIQSVQQRLAQMPQQLQAAMEAADIQLQAHDLADRARQSAAGKKDAVTTQMAERAAAAEREADAEAQRLLVPVDVGVTQIMVAGLNDYQPETVGAVEALERQLTPALKRVKNSVKGNAPQELVRSIRQSREAIAEVQRQLRAAQESLLDKDPLFAAKCYADAAAESLSKVPPDVRAAMESQQRTSEALGRQWAMSVRRASQARLAGTSQLSGIYKGEGAKGAAQVVIEAEEGREWGTLRPRGGGGNAAPSRDDDPAAYGKMLQLYFRTLGQSRGQEEK